LGVRGGGGEGLEWEKEVGWRWGCGKSLEGSNENYFISSVCQLNFAVLTQDLLRSAQLVCVIPKQYSRKAKQHLMKGWGLGSNKNCFVSFVSSSLPFWLKICLGQLNCLGFLYQSAQLFLVNNAFIALIFPNCEGPYSVRLFKKGKHT
jgi:hypothetical protein